MNSPFAIRNMLLLLPSVFLLNSCIKKDAPDNPVNTPPPAITPVGTPVDNPVSKTIGSSGGSLVSADGKLELNIPAGALGSNTNISIQPVTNETPGGIGFSYHLMPDGIKFARPVDLIYHYTNEEINGTLPYLLCIAYQDSLFRWRADFKKRNVDTVAKTVSLGINHFSIWSMAARLIITATSEELYDNETSTLRAMIQSPPEQVSVPDDDLPPLPTTSLLPANGVSNWKVNGQINGNSQNGTITGGGSEVTYKAPSAIERERTVQVSAEVKYEIVLYNNGRLVSSVNKLILFKDIALFPSEFEYSVQTEFADSAITGWRGQIYRDKASFDLSIKKTKDARGIPTVVVLASNFKNYAPTVSPLTQTYTDPLGFSTITFDWIPDVTGQTNITGVTLASFSDDSTIYLDFVHTGALSPSFNWRTSLGSSGTIPLTPLGGTFGIPSGVQMILKRQDQGDKWVKITAK